MSNAKSRLERLAASMAWAALITLLALFVLLFGVLFCKLLGAALSGELQ